MDHWTDEKVAVLVTRRVTTDNPAWTSNVQAAVQRGYLKRIYIAFGTSADTPGIAANLAKKLKTCGVRIIKQRKAYTLAKVYWLGDSASAPEGQAA